MVARANRSEYILSSPEIKELFLDILRRAKRKYVFTIHNFCVMSNHIHLMILPGRDESLSRIMQWILSVFAMRYNRIFGYCGHVWYDRFKSRVIDAFSQYIRAFLYIANNPVEAHIVDAPLKFPFSGVRHIRDGDFSIVAPPDLCLRLVIPGLFQTLLVSETLAQPEEPTGADDAG